MADFEHILQLLDWHREPKGLYEPIGYTLAEGGKRLRPRLALMAAAMYGAEEQAVPVALALEIFHNFTLLHDDLMDKAPTRRGRPTVYLRWNENTAILSGDQMLIEAYKQLEKLPDHLLAKVLHIFSTMATEICEGQQRDMDFEDMEEVSADDYTLMIKQKTSVLLGAALEMGALVGGATEKDRHLLRQAGVELGLAFQIQDDILDTYGDPNTFGKAIGGDILQNKKTLLLITAQRQANDEQRTTLDKWLHADNFVQEDKINAVREIYNQTGAREICERCMADRTDNAIRLLKEVSADTNALQTLATTMLCRKS